MDIASTNRKHTHADMNTAKIKKGSTKGRKILTEDEMKRRILSRMPSFIYIPPQKPSESDSDRKKRHGLMNRHYYNYNRRSRYATLSSISRSKRQSIRYEYTSAFSTTNNNWETNIHNCKKYSKTTNLFGRRQQYMALNPSNRKRATLFQDSSNATRTISRNSFKIALNPTTEVRL